MINELLQHTLAASHQLVTLDDATINRILIDTASALLTRQAEVLAANVEDLSRMDPANPKYDRLKLYWQLQSLVVCPDKYLFRKLTMLHLRQVR